MRLARREALSLVVGLAGLVVFAIATNAVVDIGGCESGACPAPSSAASVLMAVGAAVWLGGMFISERGLVRPGAGQIVWTVGFLVLGSLLLAEVLTAEGATGAAKVGVGTVAVLFLGMGLAVGIAGVVQLRRGEQGRRTAAREYADERARVRALDDLRSARALTRPEFDQLKARIAKRATAEKLTQIQALAADRGAGRLSDEQFEAAKRDVLR